MWIESVEASGYVGGAKAAENVVDNALSQQGLTKLKIDSLLKGSGYRNKTELVEAVRNGEFQLAPNTFYAQPLGTQMAPDFIAVTEEEVLFIEVKASDKASGYLFNSHLIQDDFLYALSDPSVGFKVVPGHMLINSEVREMLYECHQQCAAIQRKWNEKISTHPSNTQGWTYYARAMYNQKNVYA